MRVQLHGGVGAQDTSQARGDGSIGELAGPDQVEQIYLLPSSWQDAPWWTNAQLENLRAILDSVKRTYNVDENRVALAGVSDGATATFYFAMRDTTPFSSFLPMNGYVMVLANPSVGAEGDLFPNNFRNKPFFIVNGGVDPLYPIRLVDPYIDHLTNGGVEVHYRPQPTAGHNTSWWPDLKIDFETFVREHPRNPLPAFLTWESGGDASTNRANWLVIDRLLPSPEARELAPDLDVFDAPEEQPPSPRLITHMGRYGRVDLERKGNAVAAQTRGVAAFTLLLSPDAFDFAKPITVTVNDRVLFNGLVRPSLATLLKWAARDNDRTMLFGAELQIEIK
jgi:predicted esterase